jgi:molybdenum cofactor cytidylyltransferase
MRSWKPLLPFGTATVIETTVGAARTAGLSVILVVGFRGDELVERFARDPLVRPIRNAEWEKGMLGSILLGAAAAEGRLVFLMNGDKPLVRPETYGRIVAEAERRRADGLPEVPLFASFRGNAGHPVLVPRGVALAADGAERMRDHLQRFSPALVESGDEGVLLDIDTPEDYERLLDRAGPRGR